VSTDHIAAGKPKIKVEEQRVNNSDEDDDDKENERVI
jgi:hypothetical protein